MNISIDDIIEERFNNYINKVTESGLPLWIAQMYGTAEQEPSLKENLLNTTQQKEYIKNTTENKDDDLPF